MLEGLPPLELLEATHAFPCQYTFKVIGRPENHLIGRVIAAVRLELDADAEPPFSSRHSSGGKHISITIEPVLNSAEQVLDVYRRLQSLEGVLMLL
ncbi:MAG: DUF493 domain-containing protein [Planctomycetaceae bacterium]|nr:DUF493 domain-containing protein [Planctomycetaceae bacterium]